MIKQAGQLDRRIVIQGYAPATTNATEEVSDFTARIGDDGGSVEGSDCVLASIEALGGNTTDNFGQPVKTYTTFATVWAKVVEASGSESEEGDMVASVNKVDFIIRYRTDLDAQMRISWGGNIYLIQSIRSDEIRKAWMVISTTLSDAQ